MMIDQISERFAVATRLCNVIATAGMSVSNIEFTDYLDHAMAVTVNHPDGLSSELNEAAAEVMCAVLPGFTLSRRGGLIYLAAEYVGLPVELYFGMGVCERVQVGTRWVEAHEEPVYEVMCADPLREAVTS